MSCQGRRWRTCTGRRYTRGRQPGGSRSWVRSEDMTWVTMLPLPLREGVGGRGPVDQLGPLPPTPSRKGRGRVLFGLLPSLLFVVAIVAAALDHAFPPDLSRLASTGTEILDRNDRPLALLPTPGGVWRFHAGTPSPLLTNL